MKRCLIVISLLLIVGCFTTPKIPTPEPHGKRYVQRGRELVRGLAACGHCHGSKPESGAALSGGKIIYDKYGEVQAPNITPSQSGVGDWTAEELSRAIRFSIGRDDEYLSLEAHDGYRWMSDEDVYAIIAYLRTLRPVEKEIDRRSLSFVDRYTVGIFDVHRTVAGYVPALNIQDKVAYGGYLVDNIARCTSCHNSPSGVLESEKYLDGGKEIRLPNSESRFAPNITGSKVFGVGSWSEEEIVSYLKTGRAPGNRISDERFCPTNFYKNAFGQDLFAIAAYLKSLS